MRFSLVMATIGRIDAVERFFKSLLDQGDIEFEVFAVDSNVDDRLVKMIEIYRQHYPIQHIKSPGTPKSAAMNQGRVAAQGEIISFPDDDCLYPPGFLAQVAQFFEDETWDGLAVRVKDTESDEDAYEYSLQESSKVDRRVGFSVGICQSMFFRAKLAKQVAFDEEMGPGAKWVGGEDTDYLLRCLKTGADVYYNVDLYIEHPQPYQIYTTRQLMRREFTYGRGHGYLMHKHGSVPSMVRQQLFVVPTQLAITYALAGDFRHALPCPGMGIGRILGYWEGMKYQKESKSQ